MAGTNATAPWTVDAEPGVGASPPPAGLADAVPLLTTSAFPTVRDRWERLVTVATIAATPQRVWRALTRADELPLWLARCHGSLERVGADTVLDFEDGEFFLVRTQSIRAPDDDDDGGELKWVWRWLGLGQAASVTWQLRPGAGGLTEVSVTEEVMNPPADWQTWNGGGWPGILEQLGSYLRTGTQWRWPWRRMGPYIQIELASSPYEAWDTLLSPAAIKFWLQRMAGDLVPGGSLTLMMGDASGTVRLAVRELVDAGQKPPSFLPYVEFSLAREAWAGEVGGRLWIEPAGWGRSLLQVFHYGWESLPPSPALLEERKILTTFWAGAGRRAHQLFLRPGMAPGGPHSWT